MTFFILCVFLLVGSFVHTSFLSFSSRTKRSPPSLIYVSMSKLFCQCTTTLFHEQADKGKA